MKFSISVVIVFMFFYKITLTKLKDKTLPDFQLSRSHLLQAWNYNIFRITYFVSLVHKFTIQNLYIKIGLKLAKRKRSNADLKKYCIFIRKKLIF